MVIKISTFVRGTERKGGDGGKPWVSLCRVTELLSKRATAEWPFEHAERVMGIEPTFLAWEANVLPLNYTRGESGL
jgi:hypothetical protein